MRTMQCSRCLHYRGNLECDAFPDGIPEIILTGYFSHTKPYEGDNGIRYRPVPGSELEKSEEAGAVAQYLNRLTAKERKAYERVKQVLIRQGYQESDFEEGGVLYGYSVNELIDMARVA